MTQSLTQEQSTQLQACFSLAQNPTQQPDASQMFALLRQSVGLDPAAAELMEALWNEILVARRTAAFWQQMTDIEKEMTEKLAANHFQLKQNYIRLLQEQ